MSAIAESVPGSLRLPLFGLSSTAHLSAQVIGLAGGAGLTMAIGVRWALTADIASFALTAAILATLPIAGKRAHARPPATYGFRIIWAQPTLRLLALTTWTTFMCSALPEIVAPQVATGPWLPLVLASSAAGGAVSTIALARHRFLNNVANQFKLAAGLGLALITGAGLLLISAPVWAIALVNAVIGAAGGWMTGAQVTFTKLAPAEHMGQVEATMVASNIVSGGIGILLLGGLVVVATPGAAYLAAGALVLIVAVTSSRRHRGNGRYADRRSRPVQHTTTSPSG